MQMHTHRAFVDRKTQKEEKADESYCKLTKYVPTAVTSWLKKYENTRQKKKAQLTRLLRSDMSILAAGSEVPPRPAEPIAPPKVLIRRMNPGAAPKYGSWPGIVSVGPVEALLRGGCSEPSSAPAPGAASLSKAPSAPEVDPDASPLGDNGDGAGGEFAASTA